MRVRRRHAGLDPASIILSRCPGQLTAPMDSCFRRNGSGNGFLLSQEWEWEWRMVAAATTMPGLTRHPLLCRVALGNSLLQWIPAFAGMGVGVCAGVVAATATTMPGLTRHPLLCRVALGNSLLQWIPAFAGMGVGMDSCFRRNGSGSGFLLSQEWEWEWIPAFAGMGVGVCAGVVAATARHHAGLDPASIIMSRCPGQLTAPMDSCFAGMGVGVDSCFRRNGSGNGFLLSQEWEWEWIPAFAGMGVGMDSCFRRNGSGSGALSDG